MHYMYTFTFTTCWALLQASQKRVSRKSVLTWTGVTRVGHDGTARGLGARSNTAYPWLSVADGVEEVQCLFAFLP